MAAERFRAKDWELTEVLDDRDDLAEIEVKVVRRDGSGEEQTKWVTKRVFNALLADVDENAVRWVVKSLGATVREHGVNYVVVQWAGYPTPGLEPVDNLVEQGIAIGDLKRDAMDTLKTEGVLPPGVYELMVQKRRERIVTAISKPRNARVKK